MNNFAINVKRIITKCNGTSYAKQCGLRSMQNINGTEKEIIEAYRNELTHDIWGDKDKLTEWVNKKFIALRDKNYTSTKISDPKLIDERNNAVKSWAELINENDICKNNPFIRLKVLRSIVDNLKNNNMQFPPVINKNIFSEAVYEVKKQGSSFKKSYFKLFKEFHSIPDIKIDEVSENGIRGTWYSLKVPDYATAKRQPGIFNKIKEFISVLSQGSNWCIRNPKAVSNDFIGMDFHVFVDSRGYPQLCMAGSNKNGGWFKYIKGNDQYAKISDKYKEILKLFIEKNELNNAVVGETDASLIPILDILK